MIETEQNLEKNKFPSYVIGPWTGEKQKIPNYMISFFEEENVVCRNYISGENAIQLMVSVHNNERHSMHSPEYCLKGADWKILNSETYNFNDDKNIKLISAQKGNTQNFYAYWFSQDGEFFTDMFHVLKRDVKLRLKGQARNWVLTRIKSQNKNQLMNFINHLMEDENITRRIQCKNNTLIESTKNES